MELEIERWLAAPWVQLWTFGGEIELQSRHPSETFSGDLFVETPREVFRIGARSIPHPEWIETFSLYVASEPDFHVDRNRQPWLRIRKVTELPDAVSLKAFMGEVARRATHLRDKDGLAGLLLETHGARLLFYADHAVPESAAMTSAETEIDTVIAEIRARG